jgi:hypothetical protein
MPPDELNHRKHWGLIRQAAADHRHQPSTIELSSLLSS